MEVNEKNILAIIEFIKETTKKLKLNPEEVFLNGNCGNLYTMLSEAFPNNTKPYVIKYLGEPYHIIAKINNSFYDIGGKTSIENYVNYIKNHNPDFNSDFNDFSIQPCSNEQVEKNSNMYDYDESYHESRIANLMWQIEKSIEQWRKDRDINNKNNNSTGYRND